ncbi:unnamed protein product [Amoebophrya sp. A120]|nr:unnamed protein product [Amoebophrya sp. A120]|eukprot:GSA120T00023527001.1
MKGLHLNIFSIFAITARRPPLLRMKTTSERHLPVWAFLSILLRLVFLRTVEQSMTQNLSYALFNEGVDEQPLGAPSTRRHQQHPATRRTSTMFPFVAAGTTRVLDPGGMLVDSCRTQVCSNNQNMAKLKIALEQIETPPQVNQIIIEVEPFHDDPQKDRVWESLQGDQLLHEKAVSRLRDCENNMAEDKKPCPYAYVVLDSHPKAELDPTVVTEAQEKFSFSQFGIAVALSAKTDFNCMREHLRVFLRNIADHNWTSHMHWVPYLLPQVLDAAVAQREDMCSRGSGSLPSSPEGIFNADGTRIAAESAATSITEDFLTLFSSFSNRLHTAFFLKSEILLPLGFMAAFAMCTLLVLYILFVTVAPPPARPPSRVEPGDYQLTDGQGVVVRFAPASDAPVVGELESGEVDLTVVSVHENAWLEISLPYPGWIEIEALVAQGEKGGTSNRGAEDTKDAQRGQNHTYTPRDDSFQEADDHSGSYGGGVSSPEVVDGSFSGESSAGARHRILEKTMARENG